MKDKDSIKLKELEKNGHVYNAKSEKCSVIKSNSKQKELELFLKLHIANHRPG